MNQLSDGTLVQMRTASMAGDLDFRVPGRHIYLEDMKSVQTFTIAQESLPYPLSFYIPTQDVLRQWLMEEHGMYIELNIDFWGDDEKIKEPAYRAFIWRVGHPKPRPADDLGCSKYSIILETALEECLEILLYEKQPRNRHIQDKDYNRI